MGRNGKSSFNFFEKILMTDAKTRENLRQHILDSIKINGEDPEILDKEWNEVQAESKIIKSTVDDPESRYSAITGRSEEHWDFNRYIDITAYDATRVELKNCKYVNASWIDHKKYIAAQGPLDITLRAFWEVILEHNVKHIIMLCKLEEIDCYRLQSTSEDKGPGVQAPVMRVKCARYWPQCVKETMFFAQEGKMESISVSLKSEKFMDGIVVREIEVKSKTWGKRKVVQFQMMTWPDFGIPQDPSQVFEVVKVFEGQNSESLKSRKKAKHPPLIHCSAGVGRTGVFIAFLQVKYILKRDVLPTNFSVRNCVRKLRQQRYGMIQTKDQYYFLYRLIAKELGIRMNMTIEEDKSVKVRRRVRTRRPKSRKRSFKSNIETVKRTPSVSILILVTLV